MIRKSTGKTDLPHLMPIWLQTNIAAHSFIAKEYWHENYSLVEGMLPKADMYVFEEDGTILGFIGIMDSSYIAGLFVLPQHQAKQIGSRLLQHCMDIYPHLELDVYKKNTKAVAFYQKNSFVVKQEKTDGNTNQPEYHMTWSRGAE